MNLQVRRPPRGEIRATDLHIPGKRPYNIILLWSLCFSSFVNCELKWDVQRNELVFGKEAVLTCRDPETVCSQTRKWIGGKDYNLLCINGISTNPSKYQMISDTKSKTFDLMIKQLELDDIGYDYTCSCGFSQYTRKLELQNLSVTYPPNLQIKDASFQEINLFHMDLIIDRVYPVPNCSIIYINEGNERTENITKVSEERLPDGMMYKVIIRRKIKTYCLDNINITCQIWSEIYEVKGWRINGLCSDKISKTNKILIDVLSVSVVSIPVVGLLIIYICWYLKRTKCDLKRNESADNCISTELSGLNKYKHEDIEEGTQETSDHG